MTARSLDAIIFDVDGTLAETEELHRTSFNRAFEEYGLQWNWAPDLYRELLGVTGGKERMTHYALQTTTPLEKVPVAALHRRKTEIYTAAISRGEIALRPGIAALLDAAERSGIRCAISTTTSLENVESLLTATLGGGAMARFASIVAGDMVARKKPAPDAYLHVLADLGVRPGQCVAIEDSRNGLRSARDAGIDTIITSSLYMERDGFDDALAVLPSLEFIDQTDPVAALRALRDDAHRAKSGGQSL